MRKKFTPIVTGAFIAVAILIAGYVWPTWNRPDTDWRKTAEQKTDKESLAKGKVASDAGTASGIKIEVEFEGELPARGQIVAGLFDQRDKFEKRSGPVRACFLKLENAKELKWEFEGVAPGKYAISVYHDLNENETLDKGAFGVPTEKYGFSNNARSTFGPPDFEACLVDLTEDKVLKIELK